MIYILAFIAGLLLTLIAGEALQADDTSSRLSSLLQADEVHHDD
jgi:hypothetical protein